MNITSFENSFVTTLKNIMPEGSGWYIYDEKQLKSFFGEDISGIDICCINGNFMFAIQCKYSIQSSVKDMTHFIYSADTICNERFKTAGTQIYCKKIWACSILPQASSQKAAERNSVTIICDFTQQNLANRIIDCMTMLFNEYKYKNGIC